MIAVKAKIQHAPMVWKKMIPWRILLIACALFVLASPVQAASPSQSNEGSPEAPADVGELRSKIRSLLEEAEAPGAGVAVVEDGEVTMAEGFGLADREQHREATSETIFRLGSVTKTFVALAVLKLQEQGELDLRDKVRDLAPELPIDNPYHEQHPVRLVHLLEHTAGLRDMTIHSSTISDPDNSILEGLERTRDRWRVRWPPGRYYAYSNAGPSMAAHIVESTTDTSLQAFTRQHIFEPLDMGTAVWHPEKGALSRFATGYRADGTTAAPFKNLLLWPAGNLSMSVDDMGTFLTLMANRGKVDDQRILESSSIERSELPETTWPTEYGVQVGYGLGNLTEDKNNHLLRGHDGAMVGFRASYRYIPEADAGFIFSINASDNDLSETLKSTLISYVTRNLKPLEPTSRADIDTQRLEALAGYYQPTKLRQDWGLALAQPQGVLHVQRHDDTLRYRPLLGGEATTLIPTSSHTFRPSDSPRPAVAFDDPASGPRRFGLGTRTLERVSPLIALGRLVALMGAILAIVSACLFSLVWGPRWGFGSLSPPRLSARVATASAAWLWVLQILLLIGATQSQWIETLGTINGWTLGIAISSSLFGVVSLGAVIWLIYLEATDGVEWEGWGAWLAGWHTRCVAAALLFMVLFLGYYDVLVLRTWTL